MLPNYVAVSVYHVSIQGVGPLTTTIQYRKITVDIQCITHWGEIVFGGALLLSSCCDFDRIFLQLSYFRNMILISVSAQVPESSNASSELF